MSPTPGPRRGPTTTGAAAAAPPAGPPAAPPSAVPLGWSAANPVDDDDSTAPLVTFLDQAAAAAATATPPAPRKAAAGRAAPARPAPPGRPAAATGPAPSSPPTVGVGAPRTEQTGKPRVDWKAYDAQVYDTEPEWVLYRCWTRVPIDGRWWVRWGEHVLAFILGRRHQLLWIGISVRAGIARATEHLADKNWRRLIHVFEIDPDVSFATERDAELYEDARIAAECPRFNTRGNDRAYNPGAVHLTKRFHTRHRADQQHQAGQLALVWFVLTAVFAWLLHPEAAPGEAGFLAAAGRAFTGIMYGVAAGAVAMNFWRIIRLAVRGHQPTTMQKARIAKRNGAAPPKKAAPKKPATVRR
jgi:hypothetical protein